MPWHTHQACPICALPTANSDTCGRCLRHPPAFDATHAALAYRFPVDAVLQRYKYDGFLAVANLLGDLLAHQLATHAVKPDAIIPMPLHCARLQERGFNQAVEIGRRLSRQLAVPLDVHSCTRPRPTAPQAGLSLKQRMRNLRGAFACSTDFSGRHVALLDDIMTTGASLDALARTMKAAGAKRVECWVVARTLPDRA